ncbi:MAG: 1-deoxy-D-xylulose-5-phosphate synthase [Nitrospirae bacterium RIFCSPHIGHO2_02_FULL_42_12]|nr:MAG: 1-deoxy-D-xylulose-5-phosphate synthase [Nitrospirae bacterium RIFCSPHIGHO2_02_FULL_42_12]
MKYLDTINSPKDLKQIPLEELPNLAKEIRERIIEVVSKTGGHLASNLGIVELTIALHYIFDAPDDLIIWDVGHQAYVHKILTGRRDKFHTLRQHGGISGFPRPDESPYDTFNMGHSGTSLSAALGMLEARDKKKRKNKVIVVIGDGSMTAGMVFEGLNHAGDLKKDIIVILNDNEMSISRNVGAISSYLGKVITGELYTKVKKETEQLIKNIPRIGEPMLKVAKKAEESVKGLMGPGMLFEELGFKYVGPISGHRFDHLFPTLENIKKLNGPVLVHVVTKKGKDYPPAERDPAAYHGVPAFDIKTGLPLNKSTIPTYTKVFGQTISKLAETNEKIVAISAAMPEGTGLSIFSERYPDRFYDVGIAEQHGVTFAAGLASGGFHPVVAIYSTFLQRAYDQIAHDVCLQNLPVTFAMDRAGLVGEDGPTHHGTFDISYLRHLPNIIIMAPKDEDELQHMLYTSVNYQGPSAIRYPRGTGVGVELRSHFRLLEIGKGEIIFEGSDVAIIAIGNMVYPSIEAAGILKKRGIDAAVINARFIKPVDESLIISLANKYHNIITVEEGVLAGGFGSAVLETLERNSLSDVKVKRIGLPDKFIEHGSIKELHNIYGLDAPGIAQDVQSFLSIKNEKPLRGLLRNLRL